MNWNGCDGARFDLGKYGSRLWVYTVTHIGKKGGVWRHGLHHSGLMNKLHG